MWFILVGATIVVAAIISQNFIREPNTSPTNACINNLRQIDGAKQQWGIEHHKTISDLPTWDDVKPYLAREGGDFPKCPSGGNYTLGFLSNAPACSIQGHVLPWPPS